MTNVYQGDFDNWEDVQCQFAMTEKEPTKVIYAAYDTGNWEGHAVVAYRKGRNKYYLVEGGHCSCYGLEGQWDPTEYIGKAEFIKCVEPRATKRSSRDSDFQAILANL